MVPVHANAAAPQGKPFQIVHEALCLEVVGVLIGLLLGYLGSIPAAGPLAMLIVSAALDSERPRALRLALGGALAEGIWASVALLGVQQLASAHPRWLFVLQLVSAIVLVALGASMLRPRARRSEQPASHAHVLLGFVIVATNPAFLVAWTAFAAMTAPLHLRVAPVVLGGVVGIVLWFMTLFAIVARVRERFAIVDKLARVLGVVVIGFGLAMIVRLLR
jgi:threonine/homoserine/homoserine lactone efflux protein